MRCYPVVIALSALATMFVSVHAADTQTTGPALNAPAKVGEGSRDWLDLQRNGEQASPTEQRLPPAIQDRVYQRYLDNFEYPIPENFYSRDRFVEGQ